MPQTEIVRETVDLKPSLAEFEAAVESLRKKFGFKNEEVALLFLDVEPLVSVTYIETRDGRKELYVSDVDSKGEEYDPD